MINEIAYELVKDLAGKLQFADKWAGLVVPMRKMDGKIERIIPAAMPNLDNCDNSDYIDLIPDSTKTSIMYVERIGDIELEPINKNYWMASANLRFVLWYNLNRITEGNYVDEGVIASNLLSWFPRSLHDDLFTYVKSVNIFVEGAITGAEIFQKYTYEEVKNQFVTHPYGAVAININVKYTLNRCAETLLNHVKCTEPDYVAEPLPEKQNQQL